jgi:hypothetical protein
VFVYRVRRKLARWLPRLVDRSHGGSEQNAILAEIPIDPARYRTTDEFSFILKPSKLSGVGVFCTHAIAKGTRLALFPNLKPRYISNARLERDPRLRAFCQVYGVAIGGGSVVARSFGHMHVGWYLNHSDEPNAHHERFAYFASRDIAADEEITIDYRGLDTGHWRAGRDSNPRPSGSKPDALSS